MRRFLIVLFLYSVSGVVLAADEPGPSGAGPSDPVRASGTPEGEPGGVDEAVDLPALRVLGGPLARGPGEHAQPVILLEERELQRRLDQSLGETLTGLPGVSSTNYFPGIQEKTPCLIDGDGQFLTGFKSSEVHGWIAEVFLRAPE